MLGSLESDSALCEADPSNGRSSGEKPAGGSVASTSANPALGSALTIPFLSFPLRVLL